MSGLSPILEIASEILLNEKKELHVNAIAFKACNSGNNLGLTLENFTRKLNAALLANTKSKEPLFTRVKNKKGTSFQRGVYKRKRVKTSLPQANQLPPTTNTLFIGKAGEYAVMSEMLFLGFNVSLMTVDEGVDIVASRNNKYFHVQVKTSSQDQNGRYGFSIRKNSFVSNAASNTFYIFVLRCKAGNIFAVIPNSEIENQNNLGVINGDTNLSIGITFDQATKKYKLNRRLDINIYINNFGQIK